jgi:uncharacterized protein (TIGR02757 family)
MKDDELILIKDFLDEAYLTYNQRIFIDNDPICIPHRFTKKEDIEIAAFLVSTIAWGNRKSIINNGLMLMKWMDEKPFEFVCNHSKKELKIFKKFTHRTFNGIDCVFFLNSLKNIYLNHHSLEACFYEGNQSTSNVKNNIINFRIKFLETKHQQRSEKHISDPSKNSSSKRLCMFLRWMVRKDKHGVDFGIWNQIKPSQLCLPLDIHTGNVSRQLGLLKRTQNDWKAVEEITGILKQLDPIDPVKYDFSLFGLGANKALYRFQK